ncbi:uncharacterized protein LY89DRAFT_686046 [Mollisia scopiformis]|uniref:GPI inositol-deacylase n=1 Tax=Mollisia scopiformis TaxID=149040 RepID=A0A194X632_MOLSC|nr:uncharacterized protein LY89DRAFT_686046 [Mollisia scopiformis]KUJ15267.1 hypothetical protein LY89DRAFT_686046 [Mollisia scopiformis]
MTSRKMPYELKTNFKPSKIDVDIVAVQGLWANPEWTWKKAGVLWLADLLPLDIPNAHTMTFGPIPRPPRPQMKPSTYLLLDVFILGLLILGARCHPWRTLAFTMSAALALLQAWFYLEKHLVNLRTTPATEIHDQAIVLLAKLMDRQKEEQDSIPMILIGHSFGGLVIKQAMVLAANDPQYTTIAKRVQGFIFLGTPHRGARLATAAKYWWFQSALDIRAVLEMNSKILVDLDDSFLKLPSIQTSKSIYCFFEEKPTVYGPPFFHFSMKAVDESSATWPDRPAEGLSRKHSDLSKYEKHDDPDFQRISKTIQKILSSLP